ncbi:MAG: IS256 family transposase [Planctomycetota bacterium]
MSKKYRKPRSRSTAKARPSLVESSREARDVQLSLPLAELLAVARQSVTGLAIEVGRATMAALLEDEVEGLVGRRYERSEDRQGTRWGKERGVVAIGGQKVPLDRPRVRSSDGHEVPLERYELFRSGGQNGLEESMVAKILATVSTRRYEEVVDTVTDSYGVKKSSVSRHWKTASAKQLRGLMERRLDDLDLLAVMIDGVAFGDHTIVAALGFSVDGTKTVLGVWPGATESAEIATDLLEDLVDRGLPTKKKLLFVLDGSKALRKAVKSVVGKNAEIQRCQEHKRRNVLAYLPKHRHRVVSRRLKGAWDLLDYDDAKKALQNTVAYLKEISDSAASSLEEAFEETLTLHRLGVPGSLRRTFRTTNPIENMFSGVRKTSRNVKRWRGQDMSKRWAAAALLDAEKRFRRVKSYFDLPELLAVLRGPVAVAKKTA